jgi:excisionase family DNA binding protein
MKIGGIEVLTLTEAAERSGLSPNTLRAQIKNGVLPATLAGKTYLVTADDLAQYVDERKGRHGVANPSHPLHGKRGGGGRRKKTP